MTVIGSCVYKRVNLKVGKGGLPRNVAHSITQYSANTLPISRLGRVACPRNVAQEVNNTLEATCITSRLGKAVPQHLVIAWAKFRGHATLSNRGIAGGAA